MEICPVLDVRLTCGAASFYEAIHAAFADARHTPFQRRLSHLYDRKDDAPIPAVYHVHDVGIAELPLAEHLFRAKYDVSFRFSPLTFLALCDIFLVGV